MRAAGKTRWNAGMARCWPASFRLRGAAPAVAGAVLPDGMGAATRATLVLEITMADTRNKPATRRLRCP